MLFQHFYILLLNFIPEDCFYYFDNILDINMVVMDFIWDWFWFGLFSTMKMLILALIIVVIILYFNCDRLIYLPYTSYEALATRQVHYNQVCNTNYYY